MGGYRSFCEVYRKKKPSPNRLFSIKKSTKRKPVAEYDSFALSSDELLAFFFQVMLIKLPL